MKDPLADLPGAGTIGRMATMTGLVVVLGAAALAALRHAQGRVRRPVESGLQLHGTISLGARNGLHLVSVQERKFLVAVDARGVSCISPIAGEFAEIVDARLENGPVVDELEERPIGGGARPAGRD